jgi:hypothetical protein
MKYRLANSLAISKLRSKVMFEDYNININV